MIPNFTMRFAEKARFPFILHTLLEDAKQHDFEHIISWVPSSDCFFIVHKPKLFAQVIMKSYFTNQNRYKSFLRQLNLYGFTRILSKSSNPTTPRGAYCHPFFLRGDRDLCSHMERSQARNSPMIREEVSQLPIEPREISSRVGIVSYATECRLVNESGHILDAFAEDIIWLFRPRNVSPGLVGV
jgi:hypothetical protein